ncbi:hypothetical protein AXF42_Ash000723 [Apostasia shenzhenica]|uniref:Uncharacterized protein n=1 Tax=Apostasia shenzhenica TaxID=1088818 RepID=A0A2I0AH76_9ASPA|nr:hypothetical protein AXF42_Ash000723 [Apostasia shenzhenica]
MEPSSVRLNGHFISRGADFVSSLSWNSLLGFFAARGLPSGSSFSEPILVHGKPIPRSESSNWEVRDHLSLKRKGTVDNGSPPKKNRTQNIDDDFLSIKRRLNLDDDHPTKKRKITEINSDLPRKPSKLFMVSSKSGFECSFAIGTGKRFREDDTACSVSCKRIK